MAWSRDNIDHKISFLIDLLGDNSRLFGWTYDSEGNLLNTNCSDLILNTIFTVNSCFPYMLEYSKSYRQPLILSLPIGLMWCAVFEWNQDKLFRIHVLGPVFTSAIPSATLEKVLESKAVTLRWKPKFIRILNEVPVVSTNIFLSHTLMLEYCINGHHLHTSDIAFQPEQSKEIIPNDTHFKRDSNQTWAAEQTLLKMVREGNLNYKQALDQASRSSSGVQINLENSLNQAKISQIVFTTLCTRAAIEGGLSPEMAYTRGDNYIQDILKGTTLSELALVGHTMYADYINMVYKSRSNPNFSKQIQSCCDYIVLHIEEKITISLLAKRIGYAEYYLSRKFKQEVGTSVSDYIKHHKIERAKTLLTTTQENTQVIADRLNFSARSFFAETFKEITGLTPAAYRKKYKKI